MFIKYTGRLIWSTVKENWYFTCSWRGRLCRIYCGRVVGQHWRRRQETRNDSSNNNQLDRRDDETKFVIHSNDGDLIQRAQMLVIFYIVKAEKNENQDDTQLNKTRKNLTHRRDAGQLIDDQQLFLVYNRAPTKTRWTSTQNNKTAGSILSYTAQEIYK